MIGGFFEESRRNLQGFQGGHSEKYHESSVRLVVMDVSGRQAVTCD